MTIGCIIVHMGFLENLRKEMAVKTEAQRIAREKERLLYESYLSEYARKQGTEKQLERQRPKSKNEYWQKAKGYFEQSGLRGMFNEMIKMGAAESIIEDKDNKAVNDGPCEDGFNTNFSVKLRIKTYTEANYDQIWVWIDVDGGIRCTRYILRAEWENNRDVLEKELEEAYKNPARHRAPVKHVSYVSSEPGSFCLPGNSLISVPNGFVAIEKLKNGDLVWTIDKSGHRVQTVIVQKTKRHVFKDHKIANIVLRDRREIYASPGHPTIDNEELGALKKGQILDGAQVASTQIISYQGKYTHDILPSGETGGYWANSMLIGSTLSSKFRKTQVKKTVSLILSRFPRFCFGRE